MSELELSLVVPAHDEAAGIAEAVRAAVAAVAALAPDRCEVLVVDDGSTDDTGTILDALAAELAPLEVLHLARNVGHGPALMAGCDRARGRWIAHLDADDQIPADELALLWARRDRAPLVLGTRTDRDDPRHRLVVTTVTRALTSALAGRRLRDPNAPCKLVDRDLWLEARNLLPDDTFAPSIGLAVIAARTGRTIEEVPVAHRARRHGRSSLRPVRLARALGRSARQTVGLTRRLR